MFASARDGIASILRGERTEDPLSEDVVQGWAPVYPHIRYEKPDEAIAWWEFSRALRIVEPEAWGAIRIE
jgi:hypothetical protein